MNMKYSNEPKGKGIVNLSLEESIIFAKTTVLLNIKHPLVGKEF
jgi:hypothetical protein